MLLTQCQRGSNAFLEKRPANLDALWIEHAHMNLRFGIVEANPEKPLARILHLDNVAVLDRLSQP